ncbi:helicase protein MOM1 [Helianthus annuus]|uniref:helicase protein MOM1 n=1 Tax=Helianthus annuus TaxID=4232 RepID=UPI001652C67A|nr:helicase protein MOM1 [Helianthus annuus]
MHLKKFRKLTADMKVLTVSGEPADILQSYRIILSLVDCENEKLHANADMEVNNDISALKERLSPFVAFECKFTTLDLQEYWVPVHLSSMQIEQYCSILASNSDTLSSLSKTASLNDVITQIQKCCDHPYLVDPTLRNSTKEPSLIDPLAAEVNVSGKLHVFDKLLLEIKRCGLRALVLFHSSVNSEKISTGHFLDDLVHQRFGENSYVYIPGRVLSNSAYLNKKEALEMFNKADSDRFICLCDHRACLSSLRLSRVDVVILFNSDPNPLNDVKALKRITIDSHCERLNVFRLYSVFTSEEKALILSKQGTTVDGYISWSVYHQLLGWGATYVFSKLKSCSESEPLFRIDDLVRELSTLLMNTRVETERPIVSHARMQDGAYSGSVLLFGETETETHSKEKGSCSIDEYLVDNRHSVFWSNLVKQSQPVLENSCSRLSRRVQKSPQYWFEGINATSPSFVRSKPRSKRKLLKNVGRKRAGPHTPFGTRQARMNATEGSSPRTNGGQQSQTEQPPPDTSTSTPLDTEIERIQKEREKITKSHQEEKSMLLSELEKVISEAQKKYDALVHDSETKLADELKILEDYEKLVSANKLLAEILAQNWQDALNPNQTEFNRKRKQKDTSAFSILQIPASALVRPKNPCLTRGPTSFFPAGPGLRSPAPHLRSSSSMFASLRNLPATGEPSLSVNYPNS